MSTIQTQALVDLLSAEFGVPAEVVAKCLPEALAAARVICRSRLQSPTPARMLVYADGAERPADE